MRVLNLFAGLGGNRLYWGNKHQITAVEYDPKIAAVYQKRFPNDDVVVGDAYQYLLDYFEFFDIAWLSPPCQTHTKLVVSNAGRRYNGEMVNLKLPDLRLYSVILFLKEVFRGNWAVENVKTYYKPLIKPTCQVGKHYIWSNVPIPNKKQKAAEYTGNVEELGLTKDFDITLLEGLGLNKIQVLRNCVNPEHGSYVFKYLLGKVQMNLFDAIKQNHKSTNL